jgi:hypothetical protein
MSKVIISLDSSDDESSSVPVFNNNKRGFEFQIESDAPLKKRPLIKTEVPEEDDAAEGIIFLSEHEEENGRNYDSSEEEDVASDSDGDDFIVSDTDIDGTKVPVEVPLEKILDMVNTLMPGFGALKEETINLETLTAEKMEPYDPQLDPETEDLLNNRDPLKYLDLRAVQRDRKKFADQGLTKPELSTFISPDFAQSISPKSSPEAPPKDAYDFKPFSVDDV